MTKKKKKKKINKDVIIVGISALTILEVTALLKGIDGTFFTLIAVLIAGAIGLNIPTPKQIRSD